MAYFGLLVAVCALVSLSFLSSLNQYAVGLNAESMHTAAYSGLLKLEAFKELAQPAHTLNRSSEDELLSTLYAYAATESLNVSGVGNTLIVSTSGDPRFYTVVQAG